MNKSIIYKCLINSLVIDNDLSISYNKSVVANNHDLTVPLDELYDIFKENNDLIFSYDTKNCITIILQDGREISLHEYKFDMQPVLLKITNNVLAADSNDIIIPFQQKDRHESNNIAWQYIKLQLMDSIPNYASAASTDDAIKIANTDFNGRNNCQYIMRAARYNGCQIPAIEYCTSFSIKTDNQIYYGYLPAIGQLHIMIKYLDMINYIFKNTGCQPIKKDYANLWSSSECNMVIVWVLSQFGKTALGSKGMPYGSCFPFFTDKPIII